MVKTGPPIGKSLASIINIVMFNWVSSEKVIQKFEKQTRPKNQILWNSKNVIQKSGVKCSSQRSDRSENTEDVGLYFKRSKSNHINRIKE